MKTTLEQNNFLFVCLGHEFGVQEEQAIKDFIYLKDKNINGYIYCHKNSLIDDALARRGIKRLHYSGNKTRSLFDFKLFFDLRRILRQLKINLVHVYGIDDLAVITFVLRRKIKVPLFLTIDSLKHKNYRNLYYRYIFSRIDRVFTISNSFRKDLLCQKLVFGCIKVVGVIKYNKN